MVGTVFLTKFEIVCRVLILIGLLTRPPVRVPAAWALGQAGQA